MNAERLITSLLYFPGTFRPPMKLAFGLHPPAGGKKPGARRRSPSTQPPSGCFDLSFQFSAWPHVPEYRPNPERPPPSWRPFLLAVIVMAVGWVI
jgi:hypothetical protein